MYVHYIYGNIYIHTHIPIHIVINNGCVARNLQNAAVDNLTRLLRCTNSSCDCYKMECCIEQKVFRQLQTWRHNASTRTQLVTTIIKFNNTQNGPALSQLPKVTAPCTDNCRTQHNRAIRIYIPVNFAHWPTAGYKVHIQNTVWTKRTIHRCYRLRTKA